MMFRLENWKSGRQWGRLATNRNQTSNTLGTARRTYRSSVNSKITNPTSRKAKSPSATFRAGPTQRHATTRNATM